MPESQLLDYMYVCFFLIGGICIAVGPGRSQSGQPNDSENDP